MSKVTDEELTSLQSNMISGILATQESLFKQASVEKDRLEGLSGALSSLEETLFSKDFMESLPPHYKLKLYQLFSENKSASLDFLHKLNGTLTESINSLSQVRKLGTQNKTLDVIELKSQITKMLEKNVTVIEVKKEESE
jgi:uncharacterized coiled-coil protein SlyX